MIALLSVRGKRYLVFVPECNQSPRCSFISDLTDTIRVCMSASKKRFANILRIQYPIPSMCAPSENLGSCIHQSKYPLQDEYNHPWFS